MGKARPVMVGLRREKNLRFVLKSPERLAMNNTVAVALIAGAKLAFLFGGFSALGIYAERRLIA